MAKKIDETKKEVASVKTKKDVAKKEPTKVLAKKLPKIYKKQYTEKAFEKKLLKHLYIETDKDLVKDLFEKTTNKKGKAVMVVPKDKQIAKKDFARYKVLAKQIAEQKGGIKIVPLLAVIILVVAIGIVVTLFKNIVLEKAITSSMQKIFNAKTEIGLVDLQIFDASLEIKDLQQANKDSPMKNLFQIDNIKMNFNLTELLRGKFYAEEMVVSGVALDTERKTSGELPIVHKTKEEKKTESQIQKKTDELKDSASKKLQEMFANYNPETVLANIKNELKSPEVAASVAKEVQVCVDKWKETPSQLQKSVNDFSKSVEDVTKTNWGGINNLTKLKEALETTNNAITQGNSLKKSLESTTTSIKVDTKKVQDYSKQIETAVKNDMALVDTKITEMKNLFSPSGLQNIMNEAVESVLYSVLGKYYPYVNKVMDAALSVKSSGTGASESKAEKAEEKSEKKEKASSSKKRLPGRTIYYKKNVVPKLLIENVEASGYEYGTENLLFKGVATEISSDQDVRGKATSVQADFKVLGHNNSASAVIDARSNSESPLVALSYVGGGYPIAADAQVFKLDSRSDIKAKLSAESDGSFILGGSLDMNVSQMEGMTFEPAKVCELYQKALSDVKKLSVGFNVGYDVTNGMVVSIENPEKLAGQLVNPIVNVLQGELNSIAGDTKKQVTAMLSEKTNGATDKIAEFTNIQNAVDSSKSKLDNLNAQLEAKKKELTKRIEELTKQSASKAIDSVVGNSDAASALKGLLKK